ncbi:HlyD family type I secretion periplasmic adaptor subunit [Rhodoblastus sp.]|uniref:HlyD family type I secretion periplasmic adaptor subunit n=1 Tax=Rhodoblastus sp. TaxID=1962975 RepID=UPI0026021590|nr:HlyD family type I secretion periplasmic adaptor subunit [Rhodoblastus sp.]
MSVKTSTQSAIRSFESDIAAVREAPLPRSAMLTVHILLGFLVVVGLLLTFGKIDRVISSSGGQIDLTTPAQVYQALDQSIIKSIDVREGMRVAKGQVLAMLDPTFAQADVTQLRQQVASLNAEIIRDEAELAGQTPAFTGNDDPDQRHYNELQQKLFGERDAQYKAQIKSFDEQIKQTAATIAKTKNDIARYGQRSDIADKIEGMRSKLLQSGAGSLLNQLESKDQNIEMQRTVENLVNSLKESQAQLDTYKANQDAFIQQWRATTSQDLVTSQNNRDTARASLEKAKRHQDLVRIVAEEDSIVLTIAKLSVGSILQPGDKFITAMPVNEPVIADVRVRSRDVGFIRVGDPVTIKIDAFNFSEHGAAEGRVKWISEGAFWTDDQTGAPVTDPYYKVGVSIDKMNFHGVPKNFRLMPGMTLEADINVGRRSAGFYLLEGLIRGVNESMREP